MEENNEKKAYEMQEECRTCAMAGNAEVNGYTVVNYPPELKNILEEIFTDEFMQKYTTLQNFTAFKYSSAVVVNWNSDNLIYKKVLLDSFVKETSQFSSWDEMVRTAADLYYKR